jgi:hypothetical protein
MFKTNKTRFIFNMFFILVLIFGLIIAGCDQAADIMQGLQEIQKKTPVVSDFMITGLAVSADGSPKTVSIKPKTGKTQGEITVYYEGINGTVYPKSVNAPSAVGKYAVTFDVTAAESFNEAKGLKAGTLTISVKTTGGSEIEDDDNTDDDNTDEDDDEEEYHEDDDYIEEIVEPLIFIDFEDKIWNGNYAKRIVKWSGYEWTVVGYIQTGGKDDRKEGTKSIRLRGNSTDIGDKTNRIELMDYFINGIESISFDYASFGGHKNGTIILSCKREEENWEEVDRLTNIPSWNEGGSQMLNAKFDINITDKVRFKIEKVNASGNTSVNIDNIVITTY